MPLSNILDGRPQSKAMARVFFFFSARRPPSELCRFAFEINSAFSLSLSCKLYLHKNDSRLLFFVVVVEMASAICLLLIGLCCWLRFACKIFGALAGDVCKYGGNEGTTFAIECASQMIIYGPIPHPAESLRVLIALCDHHCRSNRI